MAYGLYELIAAHKLPAIFHSGHSGIGTGMPGGGGLRRLHSAIKNIELGQQQGKRVLANSPKADVPP